MKVKKYKDLVIENKHLMSAVKNLGQLLTKESLARKASDSKQLELRMLMVGHINFYNRLVGLISRRGSHLGPENYRAFLVSSKLPLYLVAPALDETLIKVTEKAAKKRKKLIQYD